MGSYHRRVFPAVIVLASLALTLGACGSRGTSANGSAEKLAVAPDSTTGDTTFYSYPIRSEGYPTRTWTFAVIDGFWYARNVPHAPSMPFKPGRWIPVRCTLSLVCTRDDNAIIAEAEELINEIGGVIFHRLTRDSPYGFRGLPSFSIALSEPYQQALAQHAPADLPILDYVRSYDQHPDVFRAVHPTTDDVPCW